MQQYFFLSGLPRSGSTVLAAILSQNPLVHVTATSPLLALLGHLEAAWRSIAEAQATATEAQVYEVYRGVSQSLYKHIPKPIIVDKCRGWPANIQGLRTSFRMEPKIVCTVRDVASVLASFELLLRKKKHLPPPVEAALQERRLPNTQRTRAQVLWEQYVLGSWESLRAGLESSPQNLLLVEHDDLMNNPRQQLQRIYNFFELAWYEHDLENIVNQVPEKDEIWGIEDLHTIRPKLARTSPPAEQILGTEVFRQYHGVGLEFWRTGNPASASMTALNQQREART